jgi:phage tail sheath protein FI
LDVVVDAGISSITQYIHNHQPVDLSADNMFTPEVWSTSDQIGSQFDLQYWYTVCSKLISFCSSTRKDCMAILDAPRALALQGNSTVVRSTQPSNTIDANIIPLLRYMTGLNSSYGAMYITWMQLVDSFSGNPKWIPESIKAVGSYCYTDLTYNYWEAPYGLERGLVNGITQLSFNPNGSQEDQIYLKNFNYAKQFPLQGIIIQGQKTLQIAPSSFDRVNVRRLFLKTERLTYNVAIYFVGRINNFYNRTNLVDILDPQFANIKRLGGLYDYRIVCDETNNTAQVIDNKELHLAVMLKPSQAADFILVKFTALRTGGSFEEVLVD